MYTTLSFIDKIIWPHTNIGDYQVKTAYDLLTQTNSPNNHQGCQTKFWKQLWKLPIPHKIITFTWKLLQDALPLKAEIAKRGINCNQLCQLCQLDNETSEHLFIHCHFARAVWIGNDINTSSLIENHIPIKQWIQELAKRHTEPNQIPYALILVLTTLWCIWFHRNQVIFEGKNENPLETMLTAKSLMHRYIHNQDNSTLEEHNSNPSSITTTWQPLVNWQVLINTAGGSKRNTKWKGNAYIRKNRKGQTLFVGCQSTRLQDHQLAQAKAIQEATIQVIKLGFKRLIILTEGIRTYVEGKLSIQLANIPAFWRHQTDYTTSRLATTHPQSPQFNPCGCKGPGYIGFPIFC